MNSEAPAAVAPITHSPAHHDGERVESGAFCDQACLEHTCSVLLNFQLATEEELHAVAGRGQSLRGGQRKVDPLEFLASDRASEPEKVSAELEEIGRQLARSMGESLVLAPFANRLPTPSAFYQSHQTIREECQRIMTPVLFNEETEVIGIGSVNPVALEIGARMIRSTLGKLTGTQPIISKLLLNHESWISVCEKQFGI